ISVATSSKPSLSLSPVAPLGGTNTSTVVGPDKVTTSLPPVGSCKTSSATVLVKRSTSTCSLLTVTVKVQRTLSPQPSLAMTVRGGVPTGKVLPLGGLATTWGGGLHPPLALMV